MRTVLSRPTSTNMLDRPPDDHESGNSPIKCEAGAKQRSSVKSLSSHSKVMYLKSLIVQLPEFLLLAS